MKLSSSMLALFVATTLAACGPTQEAGRAPALSQRTAGLSAATGSMSQARTDFSITQLANGQVLVAGGNGYSTVASAELYDPATGTFSPTGGMPAPRFGHIGVLLTDGTVLAVGGSNGYALDAQALRYEPATGTWSTTGSLGTVRTRHTATRLADGRVLVTGGIGGTFPYVTLASCELYDPATGTWTGAAPMNFARKEHTATLLQDGRVLVVGSTYPSSAELYDPATNTWSLTAAPAVTYMKPQAFALADGRVLVVGGEDGANGLQSLASAELYDPASGSWSATHPLNHRRRNFSGAVLATGRVLVFGGFDDAASPPDILSVERYDPATGLWSLSAPLLTARSGGAARVLNDDSVLVLGGDPTPTATAERYTDSAGTCSPTSCEAQGKHCGPVDDGCGNTLLCGTCEAGFECSAQSVCEPETFAGAPVYDSTRGAPRCSVGGPACDSGDLLVGRGPVGPEPHAPNQLPRSFCWDGPDGLFHQSPSLDRLAVSTLDGSPLAAGAMVKVEATVWTSYVGWEALDVYAANNADSPAWTYLGTLTPSAPDAQTLSLTYTLPLTGAEQQVVRGVYRAGGSSSLCGPGSTDDTDDLVFPVAGIADPVPSVQLTAPTSGSRLTGTVLLQASASDDQGITRVEFYRGSVLLGTSTSAPYTYSWDTLTSTNGSFELRARAYDTAGQATDSLAVDAQVANDREPPTASIHVPTAGQTSRGWIYMEVAATDDASVDTLEAFVDGSRVYSTQSGTTMSITAGFYWDSSTATEGAHTLVARATDGAGKVTDSAPVQFYVDRTAPVASITSPVGGATVSGSVQVAVSATDNQRIQRVELRANGTVVTTTYTPGTALTWNTTGYANGAYTLVARAYDAGGLTGDSAPVQVTVSNVSSPPTGTPADAMASYDSTRRAPGCAQTGARSCDSGTLLNGRATLGPEAQAPNTLGNACMDGTAGTYHSDESLDRLKVSTVDGSAFAPGKQVKVEATVWAWGSGASDALDLYYAADATNPVWTRITTLVPPAGGAQVLSATFTLPSGSLQAVRGVFRYGGSAVLCASDSYNDHDDLFFKVQ